MGIEQMQEQALMNGMQGTGVGFGGHQNIAGVNAFQSFGSNGQHEDPSGHPNMMNSAF